MSEYFDSPEDNPFVDFLRQTMGDEADEIISMLRDQGIRPEDLSQGMSTEGLKSAFQQLETLINRSSDPVNWPLASDIAKQGSYSASLREPTAAEAQRARQALTVADLWLDAVTEFAPGQVNRHIWSRHEWIESTLPTWKRFAEPVVKNLARAFSDSASGNIEVTIVFPGAKVDPTQMLQRLLALMFAHSIGHALANLAQESFGSTDIGIPLGGSSLTALLPQNISYFSADLDVPHEEILQFLAVRECAHHRLFASVPWLASDVIHAVESYSGEIALDLSAIQDTVRSIDLTDTNSAEDFMGIDFFSSVHTERQTAALERLETLLALVEGWVEVVTKQATAPYLPHYEALTELMRRRRATGAPAETVLGNLLGLELRPRQSRGAARLMSIVEADGGHAARDDLWRHPDFIPSAQDLREPESFLLVRDVASTEADELDEELEKLLDGTLGWAEGLGPDSSPESPSDPPSDDDNA